MLVDTVFMKILQTGFDLKNLSSYFSPTNLNFSHLLCRFHMPKPVRGSLLQFLVTQSCNYGENVIDSNEPIKLEKKLLDCRIRYETFTQLCLQVKNQAQFIWNKKNYSVRQEILLSCFMKAVSHIRQFYQSSKSYTCSWKKFSRAEKPISQSFSANGIPKKSILLPNR